jgi:putative ABC transport system permease protein
VRALRQKLGRDLWRLRYQGVTIALVIGCGIASLVAAAGALASVEASRDAFYRDARFADVFVHLKRAPRAVLDRLRALPDVVAVEGRIAGDYRVELPGVVEPVGARLTSLAWPAEARLDRPLVRDGRDVAPGRGDEVVISDAFAEAHQLGPGSALGVVIEGRRAQLRVVGVAVSPEFVYTPSPRTGLLDPRHFGAAWLDGEALAQATGMAGAFNDAAIQLGAGADVRAAIDRIDAALAPYGGLGAIGRVDQPSAKFVESKVGQLARMARSLPLVFLAIAAFLLNVLLARIVGTQREQIAALKALGYRTRELMAHYLELVVAICAVGAAAGVALGVAGAKAILGVYAHYFKFGTYLFRPNAAAVLGGVAVAFAAGMAGAFLAVRRAVAIPPAEAMRPEPPAVYRRTALDRLASALPPAARMVVRDAARRPGRLALSALSIALATALVLVGGAYGDSIDQLLRVQFEVSHREQISVTFDRARPWRAVRILAAVPGVTRAEGERLWPVRIHAGPAAKATVIEGVAADRELHQLLDADQRPMRLPGEGLALSRTLADELGVAIGDRLELEDLERGGRRLDVVVAALVDDLLGVQGYMDARALARLLGEEVSASVALLAVDRGDIDTVIARLAALPAAAAISQPAGDRELLNAEVGDVLLVMISLLSLFAAAIAVGVIYNNARIALEVRSRDLATLRILGLTRGELAAVLLGEQAIQVVLGLPPGLWLGRAIGRLLLASVDRELIRMPLVVQPASSVAAVCVVVLAALASALAVRRRADRLDLVAVLKARD